MTSVALALALNDVANRRALAVAFCHSVLIRLPLGFTFGLSLH